MTFMKLPKAITAEELLSTPLPPVKWIVPGLLPAGLALFAGPSKAGKSWLTLWLCLQVAQGMRIKPAQFPLSPMTISCNASSQQQAITYKILKKGDATMNPTSVEAGAEVAKSAMETVIAAMSDVFTLSGTVVTEITKQPILLFCLAAGLVPVGIHIFSSLKNAARG